MPSSMRARNRTWALIGAWALLVPSLLVHGAAPASAAVIPAPNPKIADSCGIDASLVLDASGSVSSAGAVDDVRDAADAFLQSLKNTNSYARVAQFATVAEGLAVRTQVDDASMGRGGTLSNAIADYYNPKPPRPSGVDFWKYDGSGNPQSSSNFKQDNGGNQYTNWDQSLDLAGSTGINPPDLVVYITDGDPTAYDFNQAGDPFDPGPPPDVAFSTDRDQAKQVTLDRAIEEANQIKTGLGGGRLAARMLAIGVGSAVNNGDSQSRLKQISGPLLVTDLTGITSLNEVDVAAVKDFDQLAQFLREVVLQLCSPSLTIRKLAQTADSADYVPASGWDMTVTPTVTDGFNWILPTPGPPNPVSQSEPTDANGFAQFQWEPKVPGSLSTALVQEALEPGYTAGRPGVSNDWTCELKNVDGDVRSVSGELVTAAGQASFSLSPPTLTPAIGEEIVTCTVWNSYDYQPRIGLAKVNDPTEVRGDLDPPAQVTSTYAVTNPGNTPLDNIVLTDDRCAPVTPTPPSGTNVGDVNGDGRLDPGEEWTYTCSRGIGSSPSSNVDGTKFVNNATVTGTDPAGTEVNARATDDVDAFNPAILLTKLVNGSASAVVAAGSSVTYTFAVRNGGNTPLAPVTLQDVSTPDTGCADPTRGPDDPGNGDDILGLTETWTYSCTATITENTTNTATVTGTPLNPVSGQPFPDPNPPVTDTDTAEVTTIDPALTLTKDVDQPVVFPDASVTYTYTATNEGDTDLRNDTGNAGWLTDDKCFPVRGVPSNADNVGDLNGDDLMNPDESWQFTCTSTITEETLNTATIVAQPVVGGQPAGGPLTRSADALVEVVEPGIALDKVALKPVVLDPDTVYLGPQVPDPAEYLYEVTNTGTVPLRNVTLVDDTCSPVGGPDGDVNSNGVLEVDEVWTYGCRTNLERQQGTPPPRGRESGLVTNTATVGGTPFLPQDPTQEAPNVSDTDKAQVLVIEPSLKIEKTVEPVVVRVGGEVTYSVKVANTGDVGLRLIGPADDKCTPLQFTSGDTNRNNLLDGANSPSPETWTFTCTRSIGMPEAPATTDTNTVSVTGVDPLGNRYIDKDTAEVRVIDPAIHLVKTVSDELVPSGTQVTYEFLVTNVGASPLAQDDVLAEVTLVDVAEPAQPGCATPTLVAKEGGNADEFLDRVPAETWRYRCTSTITRPTTNIAVVLGLGGTLLEPPLEVPVFDAAGAFVQPFSPGIEVVKSAVPTELPPGGGPVTYTYAVRNTGDVPLADVSARITDDTCSPVTYVSGDLDGDELLDTPTSIFEDELDETWVFTCTTTVNRTTTNTVVTTGTPVDPGGEPLCGPSQPAGVQPTGVRAARIAQACDVTDSDKETVTVLTPGSITVVKLTVTASDQQFGFEFGAEVFPLVDGGSRTFEGLAPGSYSVREQAATGWDLVDLVCDDPTGDTDVDLGEGLANVSLAGGESVVCTYTNELVETPPEVQTPTDPGDLPGTGAHGSSALLAAGAGLLGLGAALLVISRRRRPTAA